MNDKALSQEPCVKTTTEDAIKTIQELMIACTPDSKYYRVGQTAISAMLENEELSKDLDEALQEIDEYEQGKKDALSQEPICDRDCEHCTWTECPIEPCDDAISRADAEQMFRNIRSHLKPQDYKSAEEFNTRDLMLLNAEQMIHALPSVTQKSGKWIYRRGDKYSCSKCGTTTSVDEAGIDEKPMYKFCPYCGARMFEPQESEDKE